MESMAGTVKVAGLGSQIFQGKSKRLLPTADEMRRMLEAFAPLSDRFEIFTCCDSIHSRLDLNLGPMSYYLGLPNERVIHINSTYLDMVKFPSLNADLLKIISAIRSTVIRVGPRLQAHDWSSLQVFRVEEAER